MERRQLSWTLISCETLGWQAVWWVWVRTLGLLPVLVPVWASDCEIEVMPLTGQVSDSDHMRLLICAKCLVWYWSQTKWSVCRIIASIKMPSWAKKKGKNSGCGSPCVHIWGLRVCGATLPQFQPVPALPTPPHLLAMWLLLSLSEFCSRFLEMGMTQTLSGFCKDYMRHTVVIQKTQGIMYCCSG